MLPDFGMLFAGLFELRSTVSQPRRFLGDLFFWTGILFLVAGTGIFGWDSAQPDWAILGGLLSFFVGTGGAFACWGPRSDVNKSAERIVADLRAEAVGARLADAWTADEASLDAMPGAKIQQSFGQLPLTSESEGGVESVLARVIEEMVAQHKRDRLLNVIWGFFFFFLGTFVTAVIQHFHIF
jgi:hypothetical protein